MSQPTDTGTQLDFCPAALDLPHALAAWVTMLIVTREGDHRYKAPAGPAGPGRPGVPAPTWHPRVDRRRLRPLRRRAHAR